MDFDKYIANVPDFPIPGIQFKDITTLIREGEVFKEAIKEMADFGRELGATVVMGPDARGFIFGCPVAYELGVGFIPVRKPGKLPRETISEAYSLEYGQNVLEIHKDALKPGDKVLIVDDLMATGGTVQASVNLVKKLGAEVVGVTSLIELTKLNGRSLIKGIPFKALVKYDID